MTAPLESMAELTKDADAARTLITGALQMSLGVARSGHRSLPELLRDALEDVAVELGAVEALTRDCPDADLAELVEELATGAHGRLDDQLTAEAATIGHRIGVTLHPGDGVTVRSRFCSCGWPTGHLIEGYMQHVTAVLEDYYSARARALGHETVVVAGGPGLACSCGWNTAGGEPSPLLVHQRSVLGEARP